MNVFKNCVGTTIGNEDISRRKISPLEHSV